MITASYIATFIIGVIVGVVVEKKIYATFFE